MKLTYSLYDLDNAFWQVLAASVTQAAGKQGVEVEVISAENDINKQEDDLIKSANARSGIILVSPIDSTRIHDVCRKIMEQEIVVIGVDQNLASAAQASIISANLRGGGQAGKYMAEKVGSGGNILYLQCQSHLQNAILRRRGFMNAAEQTGLNIIDTVQADSRRSLARSKTTALLGEKVKFDGVFAENDEMALGAIEALSEAGCHPWPVIVGFDGTSEALKRIQEGQMSATVAQRPEKIGNQAVEVAMQIIEGEPCKELTTVMTELVTRENLPS